MKLYRELMDGENQLGTMMNSLNVTINRDVKTIGKHINNALKEELDNSTVAKFATVQKEGNRKIKRNIEYYNLDMIISVGYRVKSICFIL